MSPVDRPQGVCPVCREERWTWQPADRIGPVMAWHQTTQPNGDRVECKGSSKPPSVAPPHRPERAA